MSDGVQVIIKDVGAQGPPGSLGFANAEIWDSVTRYIPSRVVTYLGILYVSIAPSVGQVPSASPSSWAYLNLSTLDNLNAAIGPILNRLAILEALVESFASTAPYPSTILFPSAELYPGV